MRLKARQGTPPTSTHKLLSLLTTFYTRRHTLFSTPMITHQWEAWPKNAVTPGNWRSVDPSRRWVPSPESQVFPLPPEHYDPKIPRIIPNIRPWRGPRTNGPSPQGKSHDPLSRKPSRLSIHYWLDRLSMHALHIDPHMRTSD